MTFNSRRNIIGAIPMQEQIAYHLFKVDAGASKAKDIVRLCRKTKWYSELSAPDFYGKRKFAYIQHDVLIVNTKYSGSRNRIRFRSDRRESSDNQ